MNIQGEETRRGTREALAKDTRVNTSISMEKKEKWLLLVTSGTRIQKSSNSCKDWEPNAALKQEAGLQAGICITDTVVNYVLICWISLL